MGEEQGKGTPCEAVLVFIDSAESNMLGVVELKSNVVRMCWYAPLVLAMQNCSKQQRLCARQQLRLGIFG